MIRPATRFIRLITGLALLGLLLAGGRIYLDDYQPTNTIWLSTAGTLWLTVFWSLMLIAVIDGLRYHHLRAIAGERHLPHALSLNRPHQVVYTVSNHSGLILHLQLYDLLPPQVEEASAFPLQGRVKPGQRLVFTYGVTPRRRGNGHFQRARILVHSRWGLWHFVRRIGPVSDCKIYPDFSVLSRTSLMTIERSMNSLGAHLSQRLGDGMEFRELREFRVGDTLKPVDWKATARLNKPISREYQEEKDQHVIFLLDNSRRMRAREGRLSYFDHALNALLMNGYIALDKGDAVGVLLFAGNHRWLPPVKGKSAIRRLLNYLYPVATSTASGDYIQAAEALLREHRKRSLVVIITNLHDDDAEDMVAATRLLAKHHLVMVVALQEGLLGDMHRRPVNTIDDALMISGTAVFAQARKTMLKRLRVNGVVVVDANLVTMPIKLLQQYLQLKRLGKL